MESSQRQRVLDLVGISDWIDAEQPRDDSSLSSRLCEECVKSFKSILKELRNRDDLSQVVCRSLERSGSCLILWADGYGILHGDLDDALQKSRFLRKSILELLISISQTLIDRLFPHLYPADRKNVVHIGKLVSAVGEARTAVREEDYASSDSSDSSDDLESEGIKEIGEEYPTAPGDRVLNDITDDIHFDVECLLDLEPLIKSPFIDPPNQKSVEGEWSDVECLLDLEPLIKSPFIDPPNQKSVEGKWSFEALNLHQAHLERISGTFPDARQDLGYRLIEACWDLVDKVQSEKQENAGLDEHRIRVRDGASQPVVPETVSDFCDSGLGTSIGVTTSYAETTMSYRLNSDRSRSTRKKPLPAWPETPKPFNPDEYLDWLVSLNNDAPSKTNQELKKPPSRPQRYICSICHTSITLGELQRHEQELHPAQYGCNVGVCNYRSPKFLNFCRHMKSHKMKLKSKDDLGEFMLPRCRAIPVLVTLSDGIENNEIQHPSGLSPQQPSLVQDRFVPLTPSVMSDVMAPPSLQPEQPPSSPLQPTTETVEVARPHPERRAQSEYRSPSEADDP